MLIFIVFEWEWKYKEIIQATIFSDMLNTKR